MLKIKQKTGIRGNVIITLLAAFLLSTLTFASNDPESGGDSSSFDAGHLIIHHVLDANEIHIVDGLSFPLPIILITENGTDVFSYGQFLDAEHNPTKIYTSGSTGNTYKYDHGHVVQIDGSGETIAHAGWGAPSTAGGIFLDISITKNVVAMFLVLIIMFGAFLSIAGSYKKGIGRNKAPKGLQSFLEPLILFVRDEVAKPSIGHKYERYMPFLLSIFFFIWIGNLLGLIPFLGGLNMTGNIAVTMTLAIFVFAITTVTANKAYWVHVFNAPGVPWWLKIPLPLMPIVEIIGVFSKPIVLCLRLFANITAGHIIILSFTCLIFIFNEISGSGTAYGVSIGTLLFSIFMTCLELLVAFLQAYVFTLLSALYFGQAIEEHH